MAIQSTASGRSRGRRSLVMLNLLHRLSTAADAAAAPSASPSYPSLSPSAAKSRLLTEFDPDKALSIISSVPNLSSSPASGRFALHLVVRRLARARRFADVEHLLESRKSDPAFSHESFLCTIILSYGSARMLDRAVYTFEDIPRLCSAPPTTVSFNALLTAAVHAKKHRRVPKLFAELSAKHSISPDHLSYGVLVKALCLSGKVEKAFEVLREMEENGVKITTVIYTTLLDYLYKEGKPEKAAELWNKMVEKGCRPDLTSYNVKIMHQAFHGTPEEVLESISELEADGLKPDTITFNYLMTCYSTNGRFDDAKEVYEGLKSKGCDPNASTFRVMLKFSCEIGDYDTGFEVFKNSMKHNKIPHFQTLRPFVIGLANSSKVEEAKMVISVVREKFPENLVSVWKAIEKEIGFITDGQDSGPVDAAESGSERSECLVSLESRPLKLRGKKVENSTIKQMNAMTVMINS